MNENLAVFVVVALILALLLLAMLFGGAGGSPPDLSASTSITYSCGARGA